MQVMALAIHSHLMYLAIMAGGCVAATVPPNAQLSYTRHLCQQATSACPAQYVGKELLQEVLRLLTAVRHCSSHGRDT
jgi:hypothetical protein